VSKKYTQETFCFDESKCKSTDEIDQDTPASSASQFKKTGLKRKASVENKRCYYSVRSTSGKHYSVRSTAAL